MNEPQYDAIHFLDGWTGRAWYLGEVFLCGPRAGVNHPRHATEEEAIACIRGEWQPGRDPLSAAQRQRLDAGTPATSPQGRVGASVRPPTTGASQGPPSGPSRDPDRGPAPPRRGHPADCSHKWCYCHSSEHAASGGPCRRCKTEARNKEIANG